MAANWDLLFDPAFKDLPEEERRKGFAEVAGTDPEFRALPPDEQAKGFEEIVKPSPGSPALRPGGGPSFLRRLAGTAAQALPAAAETIGAAGGLALGGPPGAAAVGQQVRSVTGPVRDLIQKIGLGPTLLPTSPPAGGPPPNLQGVSEELVKIGGESWPYALAPSSLVTRPGMAVLERGAARIPGKFGEALASAVRGVPEPLVDAAAFGTATGADVYSKTGDPSEAIKAGAETAAVVGGIGAATRGRREIQAKVGEARFPETVTPEAVEAEAAAARAMSPANAQVQMTPVKPPVPILERIRANRAAKAPPAVSAPPTRRAATPAAASASPAAPPSILGRFRARAAATIYPEGETRRQEAERAANTDALTGLANRRALDAALPTAEADPATAVVAFDLNNAGKVNKTHSQEAGDQVIRDAADAIQQAAEEHGVGGRVFRRGGDEIVALVPADRAAAMRDRAEALFGEQRFEDSKGGAYTVSLTGTHGETFKAADAELQARKAERKAAPPDEPVPVQPAEVATGEPTPVQQRQLSWLGLPPQPDSTMTAADAGAFLASKHNSAEVAQVAAWRHQLAPAWLTGGARTRWAWGEDGVREAAATAPAAIGEQAAMDELRDAGARALGQHRAAGMPGGRAARAGAMPLPEGERPLYRPVSLERQSLPTVAAEPTLAAHGEGRRARGRRPALVSPLRVPGAPVGDLEPGPGADAADRILADHVRGAIAREVGHALPPGAVARAEPTEALRPELEAAVEVVRAFHGVDPVLMDAFAPEARRYNGLAYTAKGRAKRAQIVLFTHSEQPLHTLAGHELIESIKLERPDLLEPLLTAVREGVDLKRWGDRRHFGQTEGMNVPKEFLADFTGEQLTHEAFWERLMTKAPEAFQEVAGRFVAILDRILRTIMPEYRTEPFVRDVEGLRDQVADMLARYERESAPPEVRKARRLDRVREALAERASTAAAKEADPVWRLRQRFRHRLVPPKGETEDWAIPLAYRAKRGAPNAINADVILTEVDDVMGWKRGTATMEDLKEILTGPYKGAPREGPTPAKERVAERGSILQWMREQRLAREDGEAGLSRRRGEESKWLPGMRPKGEAEQGTLFGADDAQLEPVARDTAATSARTGGVAIQRGLFEADEAAAAREAADARRRAEDEETGQGSFFSRRRRRDEGARAKPPGVLDRLRARRAGEGEAPWAAGEAARTVEWGEPGNPQRFAHVAGTANLGEIAPDVAAALGRQAGPIRLRLLDGLHIGRQHGNELASAGYTGAEGRRRFVAEVADDFDEVRQGPGRRLLLVRREGPTQVAFIELEPEAKGDFWAVKTAFFGRSNYVNGKPLLWEGAQSPRSIPPTLNPPGEAGPPSAPVGQSNGSVEKIAPGEPAVKGRTADSQHTEDEPGFSRRRRPEPETIDGEGPEVDVASIPKGVLDRMNRRLRAVGYDVRGADDVRELLADRMIRKGRIWDPEWAEAYRAATGSVTSQRERRETLQERTPHVNWDVVRRLGTTSNPREAGFIRPDGAMLNLSGGGRGERGEDHRIVGGTEGMQELVAAGYIRWMPEASGFDLRVAPTPAQESRIRALVEGAHGEVLVDLQRGLGEYDPRNGYYGSGGTTSLEFPKGTSATKVLGQIRRYFAGEDLETGAVFSRRRRPEAAPDEATLRRARAVGVTDEALGALTPAQREVLLGKLEGFEPVWGPTEGVNLQQEIFAPEQALKRRQAETLFEAPPPTAGEVEHRHGATPETRNLWEPDEARAKTAGRPNMTGKTAKVLGPHPYDFAPSWAGRPGSGSGGAPESGVGIWARAKDFGTAAKEMVRKLAEGGTPPDRMLRAAGRVGEDLYQRIEKAWWGGRSMASRLLDPIWTAQRQLTHKDRAWLRENFLWSYEDRKAMPNARLQAYADAWRLANEAIGREGERLELEVLGAEGDQPRLFKARDPQTYVPHVLTEAAYEALSRRRGRLYQAMVDAARSRGMTIQQLWQLGGPTFGVKRQGSLEHARIAENLPRTLTVDGKKVKILDTDPEVLTNHIISASRRINVVEQFGRTGTEERAYLTEVANRLVSAGWDPKKAENIVVRMWNRLQGAQEHDDPFAEGVEANRAFQTVQAATAMSNLSLASVPNLLGGWVPVAIRLGLKPTVQGFMHAFTHSINAKSETEVRQLGFLTHDLMQDLAQTEGIEGVARKASRTMGKLTGFNWANLKINQATAIACKADLRSRLEAIRKGDTGALRKLWGQDEGAARRYLEREAGFAREDVDRMVADGPSGADTSRYVMKTIEQVNAIAESPTGRSALISHPLSRLVFAYSTYVRKFARTTGHTIAEAEAGNVRPLLTLLFAGAVGGEAIIAARNWLKDREREDKNVGDRLLNDFFEVGTFGMLSRIQYAASHAGQYGSNFAADLFMPPQAELVQDLTNGLRRAGVTQEVRPLWQSIERNAPLASVVHRQAERSDKTALAERLSGMVYVSDGRSRDGTTHVTLDPRPDRTPNTARMLLRRWRRLGGTDEELLAAIQEYRLSREQE